jgi:hypothetical protein
MTGLFDLRNIEKKAFRATFQDGLLDIYQGGILLSMSWLANTITGETSTVLRFGLFLAGMGLFNLIFWGGKKYITMPRMGQVKFGPIRQRRGLIMALVLSGIVALQLIFLVGTILLWRNPGWATDLGLHTTNRDLERMAVAIIGALFVGPSMVLIAYFSDFLRGYYIAIIFSLAVFAWIWFSQPVFLSIASLFIMISGVVIFVRFLRKYPLPPAEVNNG